MLDRNLAMLYQVETKRIDELFDRFIILDKNKLYFCGASLKDLGKKCFAINEFNDKEYIDKSIKML